MADAPRRSLVELRMLLSDEELELFTGAGGIMASGGHGTMRSAVMSALYHYGGQLGVKIPLHCFKPYESDSSEHPGRRRKA